MNDRSEYDAVRGCGSSAHRPATSGAGMSRRGFLGSASAGLSTAGLWLGLPQLATALALDAEKDDSGAPAKSMIVLWLQGGPSQLETFDPHPGTSIGGPTKGIETSLPGVQFAEHLPRLAERADRLTVVRSVTSKEGDHERATYNLKTGFRPDPTLTHPSIGSVICHQLPLDLDIPRYVSILPGQWPGRGGYLGDQYDAFQIDDPAGSIPDLQARVPDDRFDRRIEALQRIVEPTFARGRMKRLNEKKTLHLKSVKSALRMMSSEQLSAFDATTAEASRREAFGDHAFGRGCLTASRLIEAGVRCVEVELTGWDTHATNFLLQAGRAEMLDEGFAALLDDLRDRELLDRTLVVCMGEFGRTPRINPADGRDHWPHGFSIAMAGGGLRSGFVYGETAARPKLVKDEPLDDVADPIGVEDVHATLLSCLGIEFEQELMTPVKRPMAISKGTVIPELKATG